MRKIDWRRTAHSINAIDLALQVVVIGVALIIAGIWKYVSR